MAGKQGMGARPEIGGAIRGESERRPRENPGTESRPLDDLHFQPGGMRGGLPVLSDGAAGVKRNLTAGEIVGQVCAVLKDQKVSPPQDRINLVFMGMGEPFLNYDNFMKAVAAAGGGSGHCGVADDGFDGGNRAAHS